MHADNPVVHDAGIVVDGSRIVEVRPWSRLRDCAPVTDLGPVTLVPGLINAHTHLGLSHLAGRIPSGLGFAGWADRLFSCLRDKPDSHTLTSAVGAMAGQGTACVVDVVGPGGESIRAALEKAGLGGLLLREMAGRMRGESVTPKPLPGLWSVAVHALYSTDPELARHLKAWARERDLPFSLHLAEVPGENELLLTGTGPFAEFLRERRILPKGFVPSGLSAVGRAHELGLLDARTLAVHCVQVSGADIAVLAASGCTVCLCPRSNRWIGVGDPPVADLLAAGVPLCLGTDSLASNAGLNMWDELRCLRELMPSLSLGDMLATVTSTPARVLGIEDAYGCLAPGRRAVWAVLPADFSDMSFGIDLPACHV